LVEARLRDIEQPAAFSVRWWPLSPRRDGQGTETNYGVVFLRVAIDPDARAVPVDRIEDFGRESKLRASKRDDAGRQESQSADRLVCGGEFISEQRTVGGGRL